MEKKFCEFCGLSLRLGCECTVPVIDKMKDAEEPESRYPRVNLMGLPSPDDAAVLAKEALRRVVDQGHAPKDVIAAALQGPTVGSSPPTLEELERRAFEVTPVIGYLSGEPEGSAAVLPYVAEASRDVIGPDRVDWSRVESARAHMSPSPSPVIDWTHEDAGVVVDHPRGKRFEMDPEAKLDPYHPRLLAYALLGETLVGASPETVMSATHRMQMLEEQEAAGQISRSRYETEMKELLLAGRAVARAIHSIPQDGEGEFPIGATVSENYIEELLPHMSVRTPSAEPPVEIRFAIPSMKLPVRSEAQPQGVSFDTTRYVHVDSMPSELKAVVLTYVRLTRQSWPGHPRHTEALREFRDAVIELAGHSVSLGKKRAG